ncbi:hypothetical protein PHET_03222 [Paragonimus heterotremus]|uniref:Fibronectin type-III domain-containing protein n=1 Tax=Paragonimus heterotremus TaxID=100268 RepID=A0A8J4WT72_9TREM|nr:hypothetical protein PHET_03222 [Paragonimus heterotremus]
MSFQYFLSISVTVKIPDFIVEPKPKGLLIKWIITDYQKQRLRFYKILINDGAWTRTVEGNQNVTEVLVDELEPCHFYVVGVTTVIVHNWIVGTSWKCGSPLPTEIRRPRKLQVYNVDSGKQQVITWMRPTKMSSECRIYYVLYRSSEKEDLVKQTFNSVGPHLIDGLRPHVVYAYRVQAYFGLIPGAVSSTVKERTFPGERPATPYDFKLVPMIRSLKLLWTLPEGQCATVENYFIWLDGSAYLLENKNKTEFVFIDLHPCRFYTIELVAVSAASVKSGKVTASGTPLSESKSQVCISTYVIYHVSKENV